MKKTTLVSTTLIAGAACAASSARTAPERPNIILIFTDDQGYTDLGIHKACADVRTPQLDQLARDGVLFTRGYVTAPQCVPSRAGLLTGRYQNVFNMETNHDGPLPFSERTIADRLQEAGYATGMVGKWHLDVLRNSNHPEWDGSREPEDLARYYPRNRGFEDYWFGAINNYEVNYLLDGSDHPDAPAMVQDTRFRVDVQTEAALAFLERRKNDDRPFFLYLAWFAPHAPMETPANLQNGLINYWQEMAHVQQMERRRALAAVLGMDYGLGLIRAKLEEMGQADNTLIFYISDNGAPLRGRAYVGSLNAPTVGEKGMQTDGGQRVPFIAAWPGGIPAGQVFDENVWALDAAVTSLAVAGAPMDAKFDGVDLMPWLTGKKTGPVHDALYWRWRSQATILEGNWKFIRLGDRDRYLFDMTEIGKQTARDNRIDEFPELAARLEEKLKQKADTWDPPGLPTEINRADQLFFDVHVEQTEPGTHPDPVPFSDSPRTMRPAVAPAARPAQQTQTPYPENQMQGWVVRQGMAFRAPDDGLRVVPTAQGAVECFLTLVQINLVAPVTVEMEVRSEQAVRIQPSWRTAGSGRTFFDDPSAVLALPGGTEWTVVQTEIRPDDRMIHIRLSLPSRHTAHLDVRRIRLTDGAGQVIEASF